MTAAEVDQALSLPAERAVSALLKLPESQWYERKSGAVKPSDFAKPLIAMANAEAGVVVAGLHGGKVSPVSDKQENELRRVAHNFIDPPVRLSIEKLVTHEGKVLVFRVGMSEYVHQDNRGDCYQRMGDSTLKLSFAQRQELEWDRGASRFESTPVPGGGSFEEVLDPQKVEEFRALLTSSTPQLALQARDLLTRKGEVTVAATLLFAHRPQIFYPNAHVRILRYDDNDRGVGRRQNLVYGGDIRAEGSIPEQLFAATEAIEQLMPKRQALGDAGRFVPHPIVPKDAWLEGLVNALVHRSYSMGGDHIRVEIFPNRIEITNPGRFLGLNRIDNPEQISRNARNPRIARVCADLGITQELGEGIRRIFQEMRTSGLVDPVYEQVNESVKLTLHASNAIPADLTRDLGRAALEILKVLWQSQKQLGTGEITELVSLARPTVLRHLKELHLRGLVVWHKQSPNDPRATWSLEWT